MSPLQARMPPGLAALGKPGWDVPLGWGSAAGSRSPPTAGSPVLGDKPRCSCTGPEATCSRQCGPLPVQAVTPQGGPLTAGRSQPWDQGPSVASPSPGPGAACLPDWAGLGASPALMLPAPQGSAGPAQASREAGMLSRPQGLGLPEGGVGVPRPERGSHTQAFLEPVLGPPVASLQGMARGRGCCPISQRERLRLGAISLRCCTSCSQR